MADTSHPCLLTTRVNEEARAFESDNWFVSYVQRSQWIYNWTNIPLYTHKYCNSQARTHTKTHTQFRKLFTYKLIVCYSLLAFIFYTCTGLLLSSFSQVYVWQYIYVLRVMEPSNDDVSKIYKWITIKNQQRPTQSFA